MPGTLIVAPNWIGDLLMAQPLLARLKERHPDEALDLLVPDSLSPLARRMSEVDDVLVTQFRHGRLQLPKRWQLGRSLRARQYRRAFVLPNSWKSALIPRIAGIPSRIGYVGEARHGLINVLHRRNAGAKYREPMVEHYLRLAEAPGSGSIGQVPRTRISSKPDDQRAASARFALDSRPLAILCPGGEYGPAKRWPVERFAGLAADLSSTGYQVVALGAAAERAIGRDLAQLSKGSVRSLIGETTLDEAIDLLALAQTVIGNDSGLMHVTAALDRPQVAIFGSSSPRHTPPRSGLARVLWLGVECSPCYRRVCPLGHFRCMNEISVERVAAEVRLAIGSPDPVDAGRPQAQNPRSSP